MNRHISKRCGSFDDMCVLFGDFVIMDIDRLPIGLRVRPCFHELIDIVVRIFGDDYDGKDRQ